ncbi:MAG: hypothetical protein ACYSW8_20635 [Planctomycetota bacterium]
MDCTRLIKATWVALTVAFLITACDVAIKATRPDGPTPFEAVCIGIGEEYGRDAEIECRLLDEPVIVFTKALNGAYGSLGFYIHGEPNVYVRPGLSPELTRTVIEHETVHYVVYELQLMDVSDTCEMERVARKISTGDEDIWNDKAKRSYGCPTG